MLWGGIGSKKFVKRKMHVYSAYLSGEISELLRIFKLDIVCMHDEKGLNRSYVCVVMKDGIDDTDYRHILENNESDSKGLMLKMLLDKKTY